jgi:glycosyltransferase involved in cell wall biosynthesis
MRPGREVLFVSDSLEVGGAERALTALGGALTERGHHVTVACSIGGALAVDAERSGIDVVVLGGRRVKRCIDTAFAVALGRLVNRQHFDVAHAHMYASAVAAAVAVDETPLPLVLHEHSESAWRDGQSRAMAAAAYDRSVAVVAVSAAIARRLVDIDRVPPHKIHVLPNALPPRRQRLASATVPIGQGPLVGAVARLEPEKGIEVFVRGAAKLRSMVPSCRFVVIGDGSQRAALQQLAAQLDVPIAFLGFRSDGPALVETLDVLVVPSFSEGTPLVILEAMAGRVPVVATAVGGIPDQVRSGHEALLVPPGDPGALAAACSRLLHDPQLAGRLTAAAHRRMPSHSALVDSIERLHADVTSTAASLAADR